ncbi:MAG: hypothetical protein AAFV53_28910 [Myxococcota bacterium]
MRLEHYALRPDEMQVLLDRLEQDNEAEKRKNRRLAIGIVAAAVSIVIIFPIVTVFEGIGVIALIILAFGGIMALAVFSSRSQKLQRQQQRIAFLGAVLDENALDLHPDAKLRFDLDLRDYDQGAEKLIWSGYSPHGNIKKRYHDRWLRLKTRLADRSALIIERRSDIKTKKGNIMKRKERLKVKLRPDPKIYDLPAARSALQSEIPLLEIRSAGQGEELVWKVRRQDQDLPASDVQIDLRRVYRVLARYPRRGRR